MLIYITGIFAGCQLLQILPSHRIMIVAFTSIQTYVFNIIVKSTRHNRWARKNYGIRVENFEFRNMTKIRGRTMVPSQYYFTISIERHRYPLTRWPLVFVTSVGNLIINSSSPQKKQRPSKKKKAFVNSLQFTLSSWSCKLSFRRTTTRWSS